MGNPTKRARTSSDDGERPWGGIVLTSSTREAIQNSETCRKRHAAETDQINFIEEVCIEASSLWAAGIHFVDGLRSHESVDDINTHVRAYLHFIESVPDLQLRDLFLPNIAARTRARQAVAVAVRAALHFETTPYHSRTHPADRYAAVAFEGREMARGTDIVLPSRWLVDQVASYEKRYQDDAWKYHSPCTTVLAPSGAGKSFTVIQMATHNVYVIYSNLAAPNQLGIPGRTALADAVDKVYTVTRASTLWQRFGHLGLAMAIEAQQLQLPPFAFVAIQYQKEYALAQRDLVALLDNAGCWRRLTRASEPEQPTGALALHVHRILTRVARQYRSNTTQMAPAPASGSGRPLIVFAFDEARSLLRTVSDTNLFCVLRTVLCEVWDTGRAKQLRVFALLLNTSPKLSIFLPEFANDPSAKLPVKNELFPPIYQLQTWDVMHQTLPSLWPSVSVRGPRKRDVDSLLLRYTPDGSAAYWQYVLTLGRPLWGAVHRAHLHGDMSEHSSPPSSPSASTAQFSTDAIQRANAAVFDLARGKLRRQGQKPHRHHAIALLSFRLSFDEIHQELGQHLGSDWLHFPLFINGARSLMRTTQPSEPILALAAAAHDQDPTMRMEGVDALVAEYQTGAWHAGDSREIVGALLLLWASEVVWAPGPPAVPTRPLDVVLTKLAGCVPDDWPSLDAYDVHLTHMVRCRRDQPLTVDDMKLAFLLGQGLFPCRALPGVDIIVPLRHRVTHRITVLVVNIKNRRDNSGLSTDAASAFQRVHSELPCLRAVNVFGLYLALHPGSIAHADSVPQTVPIPWHTLPPLHDQQPARASTKQNSDRREQGNIFGAIRVGFDAKLYPVLRSVFQETQFISDAVVANLTGLLKRGEFNVSEENIPYVTALLDPRDSAVCLPLAS